FIEVFKHLLVNHHSAGGSTALARGSKTAPDSTINCQIKVGIVHDDDDILAAHFQVAMFETWGTSPRDRVPNLGRSCKGYQLDFRMCHHGSAGFASGSRYKINDPSWDSGFFANLHQVVSRMRRVSSWFENHGITTNQGRYEFPGGNSHREIPGCDERTNAQRHANAHGELIG